MSWRARVVTTVSALVLLLAGALVVVTPANAWERWTTDRDCTYYYMQVRARSKSTSGDTISIHYKSRTNGSWITAGLWYPAGPQTRETWHYFGPAKQWVMLENTAGSFTSKSAVCIDTGIR